MGSVQVLGAGDSAANYVGVEVVVFARRWRPSDFVLDPLVNVPLVALTRRQLARKLVQLSGATVPAERIQVRSTVPPRVRSPISFIDTINSINAEVK